MSRIAAKLVSEAHQKSRFRRKRLTAEYDRGNPAPPKERERSEKEPDGPRVENEVRHPGELQAAVRRDAESAAHRRDGDDVRSVHLGLVAGYRHRLVGRVEKVAIERGDRGGVSQEVAYPGKPEAVNAEVDDEQQQRSEAEGRLDDVARPEFHRAWNGNEKRKFQRGRR